MRHEAWPEILADEIQAARGRPFQWGTHDCCAFAARVVHALTGVDFMGAFPAYDNAAGARRIITVCDGLEAMVTQCLGEPVAPLCAQRGDVCLVALPTPGEHGAHALGICDGARVVLACPPAGIVQAPLKLAVRAWKVA